MDAPGVQMHPATVWTIRKTYQLSPKIELIQKKILSIIECISIGTEMKGETSCRQFPSGAFSGIGKEAAKLFSAKG